MESMMYGLTEIGSRAVNGVHDVWSDRDWKQGGERSPRCMV